MLAPPKQVRQETSQSVQSEVVRFEYFPSGQPHVPLAVNVEPVGHPVQVTPSALQLVQGGAHGAQ